MVRMVIIDKEASIYSGCRATHLRKGRLLPLSGVHGSEFMFMIQDNILSHYLHANE